jgi:hypothetical protein
MKNNKNKIKMENKNKSSFTRGILLFILVSIGPMGILLGLGLISVFFM